MIECRVQRRFPIGVAVLAGALDHSAAIDTIVTLHGCLAEQPVQLVLDVTGLSVPDRGALRPLAALATEARRWPGTAVALAGAEPRLREALTGLVGAGVVDYYAGVEEAVAAGRRLPVPPRAVVHLPPTADAPAAGRELVARACLEWRLGRWQRLVQLLTSELVMNAVVHARTPITVSVRHAEGAMQIAVRDGDPRLVYRPPPGPHQLPTGDPGRGVLLLESLADDWGCSPTSDGKVTWASVTLTTARTAADRPG